MASSKVIEVTDVNFDAEVTQCDKPVLVDFSAEWCAPCKMLAPKIEKLADEFDGRAKVAQIDIDSNQDAATKFNIRAIPTLLLLNKGKIIKQVTGPNDKDLQTLVDELIRMAG